MKNMGLSLYIFILFSVQQKALSSADLLTVFCLVILLQAWLDLAFDIGGKFVHNLDKKGCLKPLSDCC